MSFCAGCSEEFPRMDTGSQYCHMCIKMRAVTSEAEKEALSVRKVSVTIYAEITHKIEEIHAMHALLCCI
jgi:hypothetical protein